MAAELERASPHHSSPLLSLPQELRNNIYRMVLKTEGEHIEIEPSHIRNHTGILKTCRQTRSEASAIFYAENTFRTTFSDETNRNFIAWLSSVGEAKATLLEKVVIAVDFCSIEKSILSEVEDAYHTQGRENALAVYRQRTGDPMVALARAILATGLRYQSFKATWDSKDQEDEPCTKVLKGVAKRQASVLAAAIGEFGRKSAKLAR